ncbi:MAG: nucleotidyltransferase domain-containing protein [Nanoarchaeota archaeon]|nr:nucleotidyltransferase domain-containing protein [Nanoarchaeota archaeon]
MVKKVTAPKIVEQFINNYNKKYYLREFADLLKKSHQTIKPYVEQLVKENILIKNQRKNLVEYELNFKNKQIYNYLVISEKEKLTERLNKNPLLKILFEKLSSFFMQNTFVLFGSFAENNEKKLDIDLLIIGKTNLNKAISEIEEIYNKKIHKIQIDNLNKLDMVLIKEIYKKHLIFNNTEQIIRFFGDLYEKNKLV